MRNQLLANADWDGILDVLACGDLGAAAACRKYPATLEEFQRLRSIRNEVCRLLKNRGYFA